MNKLCCIGVSLAARIIGAYTMSISILMINVLMSNFFSRKGDEDFFESLKNWAVLGLNWVQTMKYMPLQKKAQTAMTCFLIYILLFLLASAYLALGSISRKHKCAVPWMYLQIISIIDQTVALSLLIMHDEQNSAFTKTVWYIPVASIYLVLSMYFWMIVQTARRVWYEEQQNQVDYDPRISISVSAPTSSNSSKSPSFLSQNFSMFESPRPPTILCK
ncbi:hypothetical protein DMN91_002206 [Ooceraea biroi]|uniref:Transmembrane protein n=1 Tax=Ooceraea biroi TaxID=2015173 RepID=A0A3L8E0M3_OOCBI|nr:uncharacterized protein LOC105283366 [Ooceraea biroi]RLU26043.1 hypothetical protein DMN91_002206 [Ooceraea biroi]